jgi:hypothetical protein
MSDEKKVSMVAELTVESPLGAETVRSFDAAWTRMRELPSPSSMRLERFVRKTDEEMAAS